MKNLRSDCAIPPHLWQLPSRAPIFFRNRTGNYHPGIREWHFPDTRRNDSYVAVFMLTREIPTSPLRLPTQVVRLSANVSTGIEIFYRHSSCGLLRRVTLRNFRGLLNSLSTYTDSLYDSPLYLLSCRLKDYANSQLASVLCSVTVVSRGFGLLFAGCAGRNDFVSVAKGVLPKDTSKNRNVFDTSRFFPSFCMYVLWIYLAS